MTIQTTANIWHNGKLIEWEDAKIHVMSHVVHYGSSVFEGMRCYTPGVFRLPEHMAAPDRLREDLPHASALHARAALPRWSMSIEANGVVPCYIRPIAFRGYGEMGVNPLRARSRSTSPTSPGANTFPETPAQTSASPAGADSRRTPCLRSPRPAPTT